jgi:hypothetical protein
VAQLSDLPTGYSVDQDGTGPRTLAEALEDATPEQAAVIKRDRVGGYQATFESPNAKVIECTATVYRSIGGAEEAFRLGVERASNEPLPGGVKLEPASIQESLGDETVALTGESQGTSIFTVVWRDRNVLAFCATGGLVATDPAETVDIALAQQERIADALG